MGVDVKTPGTWMDAADGPNLQGDGSVVRHAYLHHADDVVKISASNVQFNRITVLLGNVGSAIELGNYGVGLRNNNILNSVVSGVFIHRVIHSGGGYDGYGGIFGTRTCPKDVNFRGITVSDVFIPEVGNANTVDQVFAIGSLGGDAPFCGNHKGYVAFQDISFHSWRIFVNPSMTNKFFGNQDAVTKIDHINFYDVTQTTKDGILQTAVQFHDRPDHFYCLCADLTNPHLCWDQNGPSDSMTANIDFIGLTSSEIWFPYGPIVPSVLAISTSTSSLSAPVHGT